MVIFWVLRILIIILKAIELLQENGLLVGYLMQKGKGAYLMAKCCDNMEIVQERKQQLNEQIIKVHHPDNMENNNIEYRKEYGSKVLGSYIGTDEYVKDQLCKKIEE